MMKNLSRLTAGGSAQPEIRPGDIWRDSQGRKVVIRSVIPGRVYYDCEGTENICSFPRCYFADELTSQPIAIHSVFIRLYEVLRIIKNMFIRSKNNESVNRR